MFLEESNRELICYSSNVMDYSDIEQEIERIRECEYQMEIIIKINRVFVMWDIDLSNIFTQTGNRILHVDSLDTFPVYK